MLPCLVHLHVISLVAVLSHQRDGQPCLIHLHAVSLVGFCRTEPPARCGRQAVLQRGAEALPQPQRGNGPLRQAVMGGDSSCAREDPRRGRVQCIGQIPSRKRIGQSSRTSSTCMASSSPAAASPACAANLRAAAQSSAGSDRLIAIATGCCPPAAAVCWAESRVGIRVAGVLQDV